MKKKTFDKKDYNSVVKSTRTYYNAYSGKYVEFYEKLGKEKK